MGTASVAANVSEKREELLSSVAGNKKNSVPITVDLRLIVVDIIFVDECDVSPLLHLCDRRTERNSNVPVRATGLFHK